MLRTCSKVLLLSTVGSFIETYKAICSECEVSLRVESKWNPNFRVSEDIIICGSKYLDMINKSYYPSVVLLLKSDESFASYAQKGISRFIFDYQNMNELYYSLMQMEKIYIKETSSDIKEVLEDSSSTDFVYGDYAFYFGKEKFYYKKNEIYISKGGKRYLAEWLLNGHKDNNKRMYIYNMRKQFGENFLRDVDRHGAYGGNNE